MMAQRGNTKEKELVPYLLSVDVWYLSFCVWEWKVLLKFFRDFNMLFIHSLVFFIVNNDYCCYHCLSHLGLEMVGWIDDEWGNHSRLPSSTQAGFFLLYE